MNPFDAKLIDKIIEREGGYVTTDNPNDLGGMTYAGLTLRWVNKARKEAGLPEYSRANFSSQSKAEVRENYYLMFFKPNKLFMLPEWIKPMVIDFAVKAGAGDAVRYLQVAYNEAQTHEGYAFQLKVDGVFGPVTLSSLESVPGKMKLRIKQFLLFQSMKHFCARVSSNPTQIEFFAGWCIRAGSVYVNS